MTEPWGFGKKRTDEQRLSNQEVTDGYRDSRLDGTVRNKLSWLEQQNEHIQHKSLLKQERDELFVARECWGQEERGSVFACSQKKDAY